MRKITLCLTALLAAATSYAAETPDASQVAEEAPVEYAVELLIFLRTPTPDNESWPEDPERPEPGQAIATVTGGAPPEFPPDLRMPADQSSTERAALEAINGMAAGSAGAPVEKVAVSPPATGQPGVAGESPSPEGMTTAASPGPIQPLPAEYLQLVPQADALRRKGLEPVLHTAWRQVVGDRDNKDWLWLETDSLYGLLRVSLGRYLHLDTRLLLLGPPSETEPRQTILAVDHRRMRSGELHHLDHPGFGILVQINRYEPPALPADAEAEPLMLETLKPLTPTTEKSQNTPR